MALDPNAQLLRLKQSLKWQNPKHTWHNSTFQAVQKHI